ncbi:SGNH/GDSL hydrolase family protein, partial [Candidatus Omnitrophota bacterium]
MHLSKISYTLLMFMHIAISAQSQAEVLDPNRAVKDTSGTILWYDIDRLGIEGRGWSETATLYDRLPSKAEGVVREPVWNLSKHSAGMCVRFVTDATTIHARWNLRFENLDMPHMPATGVSGLDLYVRTEKGQWRWLANGRPKEFPENTAQLVKGIPEGRREYILYLPLYNGVTSVEVGIPVENKLETAGPWGSGDRKPIVFYGTSITHGACASRPGMAYTAILGRWFNRPVINLGFSGNGRLELELAELMAELDPSVFFIDCLPNLNPEQVAERAEPFVTSLRKTHPTTPIVLVEDRSYPNSFLVSSTNARNTGNRKALREAYLNLKDSDDNNLYYIYGDIQLGDDGEAT